MSKRYSCHKISEGKAQAEASELKREVFRLQQKLGQQKPGQQNR